jgi:hypothetical protein
VREQVARATHQERQRALRERLGFRQDLEHAVRDQRGRGGGLAQHRHPGQERDRRLLGQAPGGEVEGVDVDGHPCPRHQDVLAVEARAARELDALAVREHLHLAQALAQIRVGGQGEDRAVHVELRVPSRVAAVGHREVEQLVAMGLEHVRDRAQHRAALGEGQGAQGGTADGAGMIQRAREVEPFAAHVGQRLLGGRIDEGVRRSGARDPAAPEVAPEDPPLRHCLIPTWPSTNA